MQKTALITGATSGIGKATAQRFAKEGIALILCGRRKERLDDLKKELGQLVNCHTLCFDVRNNEEVKEQIKHLPEAFKQIDILVNNAGNAHGLDPFQNGNINDWDAMLDINVKGLLYVSKAVIPQMIERNDGHLIHIGSTAGKEVYPKGNVYCASKHAVDALNKGMRIDLNPYNIRVGQHILALYKPNLAKYVLKEIPTEQTKCIKAMKLYRRKTLLTSSISSLVGPTTSTLLI